jgi:hypothetical protein
MAYADLNNLLADYLPEAKSVAEKAAVGRILEAVSAFVDSYCRRPAGYFNPRGADTPASEKRIRGCGEHFLRLPVHVPGSIESVKHGETVIAASSYYESENLGWLYLENSGLGLEETFFPAQNNRWIDGAIYKVRARWGYAATPLDLSEAVRQTVVRWWETQAGTLGQVTPNGFVTERDLPRSAKLILDRYKRREFEI